jgi:hypothetical protein
LESFFFRAINDFFVLYDDKSPLHDISPFT